MGVYCVYKHTAPNKKVYIGITSKKPQKRWNNGNGYRENQYFYKAICKYGWENIDHEILFSGLSSEDAQQKERELIQQYHSFDRKRGYNLTTGGEVGKEHSESSKRKMSQSTKGMYVGILNPRFGSTCSEETKKRISKALKGKMCGEKNPNYGKPMSDRQKQLIGKSRTGKHYPKLSESLKTSTACIAVREAQKISVDQYTKDGEYVRTWDSAADASASLVGHRRGQSNICSCANGKLKSAYGFVWRHSENQTKEVLS